MQIWPGSADLSSITIGYHPSICLKDISATQPCGGLLITMCDMMMLGNLHGREAEVVDDDIQGFPGLPTILEFMIYTIPLTVPEPVLSNLCMHC